MEKSKLYTRTGDDGSTSLVGGARISKCAPRLESYGTIDELNSWIGLVAADFEKFEASRRYLELATFISVKLFDIGSYLATDPQGQYADFTANPVGQADIERLEQAIDTIDSQLPKLSSFVLPGGTTEAAHAHIARTVCRRCERRILSIEDPTIDTRVLRFINRLSDLLFAIARFFVIISGHNEIFWSKNC